MLRPLPPTDLQNPSSKGKDRTLGPCYSASIGALAQEVQMSICLRRREFIAGLGGAAAWPLAGRAQQRAMPVVGWLSTRNSETDAYVLPAFRRGLNRQGYVEGRNVTIEYRWSDTQNDRLPALAADLVRRQAAVITAVGNSISVVRAVQAITTTIPIVSAAVTSDF